MEPGCLTPALRLAGLVKIYVSSLLNLNEFKCSLLTATESVSSGWFSRTWGPQIWLCPAVAEGKQSALTFQSENSDKSDVLSCWDCCHTIGRMSTSHIGNVKVFLAAPCSYVTRSLVRHPLTSLCVHFNAHLFPHSCIKTFLIFSKVNNIFFNENVFLSSNVHLIF